MSERVAFPSHFNLSALRDAEVSVPIPAAIYAEIVLRYRGDRDPGAVIVDVVQDFLERTFDDVVWTDTDTAIQINAEWIKKNGNPNEGYHWQSVFLPNGTRLKMTYKQRDYFADIQHRKVIHEGGEVSPSEFANRVANNTSRNAWRDIYVKRPGDSDWIFADVLRRNVRPMTDYEKALNL